MKIVLCRDGLITADNHHVGVWNKELFEPGHGRPVRWEYYAKLTAGSAPFWLPGRIEIRCCRSRADLREATRRTLAGWSLDK